MGLLKKFRKAAKTVKKGVEKAASLYKEHSKHIAYGIDAVGIIAGPALGKKHPKALRALQTASTIAHAGDDVVHSNSVGEGLQKLGSHIATSGTKYEKYGQYVSGAGKVVDNLQRGSISGAISAAKPFVPDKYHGVMNAASDIAYVGQGGDPPPASVPVASGDIPTAMPVSHPTPFGLTPNVPRPNDKFLDGRTHPRNTLNVNNDKGMVGGHRGSPISIPTALPA